MLFVRGGILGQALDFKGWNSHVPRAGRGRPGLPGRTTPNLPTNIVPTNIAGVRLYGKSPMGLGISPLSMKIMLESNPLKSTMLVGRLGV